MVDRWHQTVNKDFNSFPAEHFVQITIPAWSTTASDECFCERPRMEKGKQVRTHNLRVTEDITRCFPG